MPQRFPGRFVLIDSGRRPGAVALRGAVRAGERAAEILFIGVTRHELPGSLDEVDIRGDGSKAGGYLVGCAQGHYRVQAGSLQIHEPATIYGRALTLARFGLERRLLWTVLLWGARFAWGRALMRRLRG